MKTEVLPITRRNALRHAVDVLKNSGLVAFPTDTVYGLGALASDPRSVSRLYSAKGRNTSKAIAILIAASDQITLVSQSPGDLALKLAAKFWPGPVTLVVPRHPDVLEEVSALATVGVRVPGNPFALRLLEASGPLAVTSANRSGEKSPVLAEEVLDQLGGRIHLILDGGRTPGGSPSTVVDCTTSPPVILRPGPVSEQEIRNAIR